MFPLRHNVVVRGWRPADEGATRDDYGNTTGEHVERTERVYGWAPRAADTEDFTQGGTTIGRVLDLFAPASIDTRPQDQVDVAGVRYEVIGYPEDFNHGPFRFAPGVRVALRRIEEAG